MRKYLQLFPFFLLLTFLLPNKSSAQTITLLVDNVQLGMYSGSGSDCGDCIGTPDPYVGAQFKASTLGTWGAIQSNRDDVGCDSYSGASGAVYNVGGIAWSGTTINVQIQGKEADGAACAGDDGSCGYGDPSSGYTSGSVTIVAGQTYCQGYNGQYYSNRENCASDGSTNDYRAYWYYRWYWDAGSITASTTAGTIGGALNICDGGNATISNTSSGTLYPRGVEVMQQSINGAAYTDVATGTTNNGSTAGSTTLTYTTPALPVVGGANTTYQYRRIVRYCTGGSTTDYASNVITVNVVPDPNAPSATKVPNVTDVCVGTTISLTSPAKGLLPGQACSGFEYSVDGGSYSGTASLVTASTGTHTIAVRVAGGCASGCNASAATTYSWNVVAQPAAPTTATASPSTATSQCVGTPLTLSAGASGGNAGVSCGIEYQFSVDGGSSWTNNGNSIPAFNAVYPAGATKTNIIQARRSGCLSGCTTSGWGTVATWTIVPDPDAPTTATASPSTATNQCVGTTLTLSAGASGGTNLGVGCGIEYQYSTDGGSSWTNNGTSIPSFAAVYPAGGTKTNIIQARRSGCQSGCDNSSWATVATWTIVPDPDAPTTATASPSTAANQCVGTTLTLSAAASGGTNLGVGCSITYQYSTDGGSSWTGPSSSIPSFAAVYPAGATKTNIIQARRSACQTGCDNSGWGTVATWTIIPDPDAPTTATASPSTATNQCVGTTLTLSAGASGGTNVGVGCGIEYQYSTDGGSSWTNNGTSIPSFAALYPAGATKTNIIQARRSACQTGCDNSSWGTVATWTIVPDPSTPTTATASPSTAANQCEGTSLTLSAGASGGTNLGVGCGIEYQYSTDGGSSYTNNGTTIPVFNAVYPAGGTKTNIIQARRSACQTGCDNSGWGTVATWTIIPDPDAPTTATKSPNSAAVCEVQTLTLSVGASGGTNVGLSCSIEYQYSTDGGTSWAGTGATIPSFAAVYPAGATKTNIIQARRISCQTGCDDSPWGTVATWTVAPQIDAPVLNTATPASGTTVCQGTNVSATITAGTGGTGATDTYQYSIDGGSTWSTYTSGTNINTTTATTSVQIRVSRSAGTGSGCNATGPTVIATWPIDVAPTATPNSRIYTCDGTASLTATGITAGATTGWQYVSGPVNPTGTTTSNPLLVTFTSSGTAIYNLLVSKGACTDVNVGSVTLVMPTTSTTTVATSSGCAYCIITDGNVRTFYNNAGQIMAKIEDDPLVTPAQLGETEVCTHLDGSVQTVMDNLGNLQPYLQRAWTIKPATNTNSTVTLYFTNTELTNLQSAANTTPYQFSGYDLWVTKYPGGGSTAIPTFTQPCTGGTTGCTSPTGLYVPATFSAYGSNHQVQFVINSFSTFYVSPSLYPFAPLPVELASFTGWNEGQLNKLQWLTASEKNTEKFEIQKSLKAASWSAIGEKSAAGNSSQAITYNFTDLNPVIGNNYYRLKIIDKDGKVAYSNVINIPIGGAVTNEFDKIYPNPTDGKLNVEIQSTSQYDTKILAFDIIGKKMFEKLTSLNKGLNTLQFDFSSLAKGAYVLQFSDGEGKTHTAKFVKE